MNLKEMAQTALNVDEGEFAKTDQITPCWVLMLENGELHMVLTPFGDSVQKEVISEFMHEHMKKMGVLAYVFLSEVWAVKATVDKDGEPAQSLEGIKPSQHPDRQEVLMAIGRNRAGQEIMGERPILEGRKLGEIKWSEGGHSTGLLSIPLENTGTHGTA